MAFDAKQWRSEKLRLLQKLQTNIDSARWLREQATRAVKRAGQLMNEVDRARSERSFQACEPNPDDEK